MEKETIYIGFSKARGRFPILSWLIRAIEGTKYSHTYLRIPSAWLQRNFYFQASSVMVNFMGAKYFDEHAEVVEEFPIRVSPETKKKIWQYCIDNAGKPYSVKQLPGIGIVLLGKALGKDWKNPFSDGRSMVVCVEAIADLMEETLGTDIKEDLDSIGLKELHPYVVQISKITNS